MSPDRKNGCAPGLDDFLPAFTGPLAPARLAAAQGTFPLPLLPSGPDGVHGRSFAQGPGFQHRAAGNRPDRKPPRRGIQPHWSGLWVTGHRWLPA